MSYNEQEAADTAEMKQALADREVYGLLCVDHYFHGVKFPATIVAAGESLCQGHFEARASRE